MNNVKGWRGIFRERRTGTSHVPAGKGGKAGVAGAITCLCCREGRARRGVKPWGSHCIILRSLLVIVRLCSFVFEHNN